jgi:hypothetical protein
VADPRRDRAGADRMAGRAVGASTRARGACRSKRNRRGGGRTQRDRGGLPRRTEDSRGGRAPRCNWDRTVGGIEIAAGGTRSRQQQQSDPIRGQRRVRPRLGDPIRGEISSSRSDPRPGGRRRQAKTSNGDAARTGTGGGRGELAAAVDGSGHKTGGYGSPNLGSDTMLGID